MEATPTETPNPAVEQPPATSLADHAAQFGATALAEAPAAEPVVDDEDAEPSRHRAKSQNAKPADITKIAELTKQLRDAEDALGLALTREEGESERAFRLRQRIAIVDAAAKANAKKPQPPAEVAQPQRIDPPPPPPQATNEFTEAEPTIEQFLDKADPQSAYYRALAGYDRRKEEFERTQAAQLKYAEDFAKAEAARFQAIGEAHRQRLDAFRKDHPDFDAVVSAADADFDGMGLSKVPPALAHAIASSDKSAELIYHFARHPDELVEMILMAEGKPFTPQVVALLQRRLLARSAAVTTGAAPIAPTETRVVPRPPTPVRTAPMKTDEQPPADEHSLKAHQHHWGKSARRR